MMVIVLEKAPVSVRGELSRWLIEPYPNVFIGHVSAMVRDRVWDKCCKSCRTGGVVQAWTTNTEQRFKIRMFGNTNRQVIDMEGLQLIQIPD
jgi:CRISPR-associated protein Cas2